MLYKQRDPEDTDTSRSEWIWCKVGLGQMTITFSDGDVWSKQDKLRLTGPPCSPHKNGGVASMYNIFAYTTMA